MVLTECVLSSSLNRIYFCGLARIREFKVLAQLCYFSEHKQMTWFILGKKLKSWNCISSVKRKTTYLM